MPDIPNFYVDLSGMFNIQKDFINFPVKDTNEPSISQINNNISSGLNKFYNDYISSNYTVNDTLEHQQQMLAIVKAEQNRLNSKKDEIDSAYTGKQRALTLNDSYRLTYRQILKIILVIIFTLVIFVFIIFASNFFPFIPSYIFEILSIIVISSGIITIYFMTITLMSRHPVYFNQLNLPPPMNGNALSTSTSSKTSNTNYNDLFKDITSTGNYCIGSSCCSDGTYWDSGNGICKTKTISPFTTINLAQYSGDFTFNRSIMPNTPNEFSEYALIR